MSAIGGPNIVEDGLVLALDAANEKSFRGEPTVNLLSDPGRGFITQSHMVVTTLSMKSAFGITQSVRRFSHTSADPRTGDQRMRSTFTITDKTQPYTYSAYLYIEPGTEAQNTGQFWRVSQTDGSHWLSPFNTLISNVVHDWSKVGEWQRIEVTFQPDPNNTSNTFNILYYNRVALGSGLIVTDGQLEQKPYPTPFVNGTRGTTVATGGGWADRSGNSIHGELVNNPTFDSDNLGSLSFDGTDEFINYGNNSILNSTLNGNTNWSISYWANPLSNGRILDRGNLGADPTGALELNVRSISRNNTSGGSSSLSTDIIGSGWNYVTLTRTASLFFQWYLNGIFSNSNQTTENYGGSGIWKTGRRAANLSGIYEGKLSNLKIYNRALSAAEVLQNYNATKGRFGL
jgi:hypothetical protein